MNRPKNFVRSLGGVAPEFCDEFSCGCAESGAGDVVVEGVVDGFHCFAQFGGCGWAVGCVEEGAEDSVSEFGVEAGNALALGYGAVGVGGGDAFDETVESESA